MGARFGVALVGQELAPRKVVHQRFEIVPGSDVSRELATELAATVLAPREEP